MKIIHLFEFVLTNQIPSFVPRSGKVEATKATRQETLKSVLAGCVVLQVMLAAVLQNDR